MFSIDLAADASPLSRSIQWQGSTVETRVDSWVVRSSAGSIAGLGMGMGWEAIDLGEGFYSLRAPGASVADVSAWAARSPDGVPHVATIVGATDYTAFQEHVGISVIDMYYDGPYGVYHSQYDNYFWMSRIGDPGFRHGRTLSELWALMSWRLAETPLLPMRYSDYARAVIGYIEAAEAHAGGERPLRLAAARAAAARWEAAAEAFEARVASGPLPSDLRGVNAALMAVERALTEPAGLQSRPFFKHLLVAPQPTYRSQFLPRIWEALDRGDRMAIPAHEAELVAAFDAAARLLAEASGMLGTPAR